MVLPHHAGKFLPKIEGFFLHDFTLIASVVGESVIGHGNVGKDIPIMARLAKARRWSKR
jgi:GH24 family phage-related lysozyme (muramidase)